MKNKKLGKILLATLMCTSLCFGCGTGDNTSTKDDSTESDENKVNTTATAEENSTKAAKLVSGIEYDSKNVIISDKITSTITLNGDSATCDGKGAEYKDHVLKITSAGTYTISGTLNDGQIQVDADKDAVVQLILDGVNVTSSDNAPFVVLQADETVVYLKDGTTNTFTDGKDYYTPEDDSSTNSSTNNESKDSSDDNSKDSDEENPSAAFYSKDDLTFEGKGSLIVNANCNDGITCKDDLKIISGVYQITAADDGIIGKDSVAIKDANMTITSGGDGIKSTKTDDEEKGFIAIEAGDFTIQSENDAIQAETYAYLNGGDYKITTAGGSANATKGQQYGGYGGPRGNMQNTQTNTEETASTKAIKAGVDITVNSGSFSIDSFDDAFHSNQTMTINGGQVEVSTGDDFLHADNELVFNNGTYTANKCYEGLEACKITVNDGSITLTASDDGFNAASLNSSESNDNFGVGPGGQQVSEATEDTQEKNSTTPLLTIAGGTIYINTGGDGLDSNGSVIMTGGTVIVDGPTDNGNGALDYDSSFDISGGILIAAGSSGMLQTPSSSSSQSSLAVVFDSALDAGTLVHIADSKGNSVLTYAPSKTYASLVVSTPSIQSGASYTVSTGGSATGTCKNGYYSDGEYSGGTEFANFTVSAVTTKVTSSGASEMTQEGMMGGQGGGKGNGNGMMGGQGGGPRGGDGQKRDNVQ